MERRLMIDKDIVKERLQEEIAAGLSKEELMNKLEIFAFETVKDPDDAISIIEKIYDEMGWF